MFIEPIFSSEANILLISIEVTEVVSNLLIYVCACVGSPRQKLKLIKEWILMAYQPVYGYVMSKG